MLPPTNSDNAVIRGLFRGANAMNALMRACRRRVIAGLRTAAVPVAMFAGLAGCAIDGEQSDLFSAYGPVGQETASSVGAAPQPEEKVKVHTVSAGDTMYSISRKHKLEPATLAKYNDIPSPYLIHPGQRIKVPDVAYALAQGRFHFARGEYGLAESSFRRAVEFMPEDPDAWTGLAASYDRLRRFDQAERAYDRAIKIAGRTPTLLNNLGYSYLLQGNFDKARTVLLAANRKQPHNPVILNNLKLLESGWESQRG